MWKRDILFLCDRNSARSPMAEGMLRFWRAGGGASVSSAGLDPDGVVDPFAVAALGQWGIDISSHAPVTVSPETIPPGTLVIALTKTAFAAAHEWRRRHAFELELWDLPDPPPADLPRSMLLEGYRDLRGALRSHITNRFPLDKR